MKKILITGSTGFLGGAFMALAIKKYGVDSIVTVARGDDRQHALERVKSNLKKFHVTDDNLNLLSEKNIICGDLQNPDSFIHNNVLTTITHVVNCAALASFGQNPLIHKVNVEGTFKFAEKMSHMRSLVKFVHVGTAMSCLPRQSERVYERESPLSQDGHIVPYTKSKAEIEFQIKKKLPQLPLIIARPSIIVGHTEYGCEASSSIFWVFVMALKLKRFMCNLDDLIDIIPVDYCAQALDQLMCNGNINDPIYHISAGEHSSVSFREIDKAFAHAQYERPIADDYEIKNYEYFLKYKTKFRGILGECNEKIILRSIHLYGEFSKLNAIFYNNKIIGLGISSPPPFTSYINKCIASTKNKSIKEMMYCDFK